MNNKRETLKKVAGVSVIAALAPSWAKPIINSVVLPSHAQMSAVENETIVSVISGLSTVDFGTVETYTITATDLDGLSSVTVSLDGVAQNFSLTGGGEFFFDIPNTLALGTHEIQFTVTGLLAGGLADTAIIRRLSIVVACPAGQSPDPSGGCTT